MYHFFTGKYRKLFLFILFITLTVIILDKNGHLNKEIFRHRISNNIQTQLETNNWTKLDLSKIIKSNFERVCIFGPYSQNKGVENLLGFKWDIEAKTSIHLDDSHNVLVFIKDNHVIDYVKHARNFGDFSNFSGQYFDKFNSKFIRKYPRKEWMHDNIYSPNK